MMDIRDELKAEIRAFMTGNALGRENAIPRRLLMNHLHTKYYSLSDRTLRRLYADLPVGFSTHAPRGIFWIKSAADLNSTIAEQKAKAIGCFVRARKVEEAVSGSKQLSLGI